MDSTNGHAKYLAVTNWEKYQIMQQGRPAPWCKLYAKVLDDERYQSWSWTECGVWLGLMALRTRLGHNLPNDPRMIARMLGVSGKKAADAHRVVIRRISDGLLVLTNQQNGHENSEATPKQTQTQRQRERNSGNELTKRATENFFSLSQKQKEERERRQLAEIGLKGYTLIPEREKPS